jgi:ABC-type branched-subunit amino acid transport system ATPase component
VTAAAPLAGRGLGKRFGALVAVEDLSLELGAGSIQALIGPNGSGKTTALRLLSGVYTPDAGQVLVADRDVTETGLAERVRLGVVRTLQATAPFGELTVLENAVVGATVRRRHGGPFRALFATPLARAEDDVVRGLGRLALEAVGLAAAADAPAGELSGFDQRLLMLATALAAEPTALLLDEPSAGAAPADLERLTGILNALRERGLAVLLVEHNLRLVREVADTVLVLDAGRPIARGSPAEVGRDPAVRTAYLGRGRL